MSILWRPTVPDFGQFYIGGILASRGEWAALYPIPIPGSLDNAGLINHSRAKARWIALSRVHGVQDYTHFILPPPSALLFIPFSLLNYKTAFWVWTFFLIGCTWGVAIVSGILFQSIVGRPTRWSGILSLLIVASPVAVRAIRIANVSPPIALLVGLILVALIQDRKPGRGAFAMLVGAAFKYATLILLPLLLILRRWKMLFWFSGLCALGIILTLSFSGKESFLEFYKVILPTLSRPSWFQGNQSLPGLLARIHGRPFSSTLVLVLGVARIFSFSLIIALLSEIPDQERHNPINLCAATGLLISWLLIFSPIAWEHWPIFLCPIWGWLIWEMRNPGLPRIIALSSIILMSLPAGIIHVKGIMTYQIYPPEPFNSTQLIGSSLVMILATWRLVQSVLTQTSDHSDNPQNEAADRNKAK